VARIWRSGILLLLSVGPVLAYLAFGALWLHERGWLLIAGAIWVAAGIVFAVLASRWTRSKRALLPPVDWNAPQTFARIDREAWALVEAEADHADTVPLQTLTGFDVYIETGRRLARTLADHYHPLSTDPIDNVPVVDLLTAFELASEDLAHLGRQVPGGDMLTPSHLKKAVKMAGYVQRANDIYSYILPIFSPVNGLARLGAQQWMVKPAWKDMQQNMLRWFFRAYVNRLGVHLIELYSGRLAIGADRYRRLTRRGHASAPVAGDAPPLRVAVAGARDAGKTRLIERVRGALGGDLSVTRARLEASGIDVPSLDRLKSAEWVEVPGYTVTPGGESARDRATRREGVEEAVEADLLILVIDVRRNTLHADAAFAKAWDLWYVEHPEVELPPAFAVLTAMDDPGLGGEWKPPYDWKSGQGPREEAARARLNAVRTMLPPSFSEAVPVGLPEGLGFGVTELMLPTLLTLFHRAERAALIRYLRSVSSRSRARRLVTQVGEHGKWLWNSLRTGRRGPAEPERL
jgi:hypothetical protein